MAEESKSRGWLKTWIGALAGVISGGMVMYLSPLVDKVIKPQKPLANFALDVKGMQVTLHNRSMGGDGFWDFGDGSPLEPTTPAAQTVTHTYSKPGQYTLKLTVRNFLGDTNERSVPVEIKGVTDGVPAILALEAIPLCPRAIAPATFRVTSMAQNVQTCVWDFGSDQPLEISSDTPEQQERLVTFATPGRYNIELAVLNGKHAERKTIPVVVEAAPANALLAVLSSVDHGTRRHARTETANISIPADGSVTTFERMIPVWNGYTVVDARLNGPPPAGVRNVTVFASGDRTQVNVTGEVRTVLRSSPTGGPPTIVIPVDVIVEKQHVESRKTAHTTEALNVPGATHLPLARCPREWINSKRAMSLRLHDGAVSLGDFPVPCTDSPVTWHGKSLRITTAIDGDQVIVTVR